jgi:hypothetical protein
MQAENEDADHHAEPQKFEADTWPHSFSRHPVLFETHAGRDILEAHSPVQAMRSVTVDAEIRIHLVRNST